MTLALSYQLSKSLGSFPLNGILNPLVAVARLSLSFDKRHCGSLSFLMLKLNLLHLGSLDRQLVAYSLDLEVKPVGIGIQLVVFLPLARPLVAYSLGLEVEVVVYNFSFLRLTVWACCIQFLVLQAERLSTCCVFLPVSSWRSVLVSKFHLYSCYSLVSS